MTTPRPYPRGNLYDALSWRRCLKGVLMLAVLAGSTEGVQRTCDVVVRTVQAAQDENARASKLREVREAVAQAERTRIFYQSPAGIAAAARPYGWGFPGERRVMFAPPAKRSSRHDAN